MLSWAGNLIDFLFIEPQTQLQVIRIEGTRFETESGIKAQIADTNSIIGRVGFRAGSNFSFGSAERISTAYIYGDVLREFKGDHVFAARGHSTSVDFSYADKETWYDAGIGANLSLSSNTDLWLNAKYIFGGYFESSRQINAGVRFSFSPSRRLPRSPFRPREALHFQKVGLSTRTDRQLPPLTSRPTLNPRFILC